MLIFCIILVKCTSGGAKPAKNTNVATLIAICKEMVRDQEKMDLIFGIYVVWLYKSTFSKFYILVFMLIFRGLNIRKSDIVAIFIANSKKMVSDREKWTSYS